MLVQVLYDRRGGIRQVYVRPEASLTAAKADAAKIGRRGAQSPSSP